MSTGTSLVAFGDELFIGNADGYHERIDLQLQDPATQRLVLDLSNVRRCDSYGLRLLINLQRTAQSLGKAFLLYRPDKDLREMLDLVKLSQFFTIVDVLED